MSDADGRRNGTGSARARPRDLRTAVRRHPLMVVGVPLLLLALTTAFVMIVPPVFEAHTSIRIDEERAGVPVLEALESLSSGSGVQTEMAVLQSRSLAEDVVTELELQARLDAPARALRSELFGALRVSRDAPGAEYVFRREDDGAFRVTGRIETPADPTRPFARATAEERAFGTAEVGRPFELEGVRLMLAPAAADHDEIALSVAAFEDAVEEFQKELRVTRPDREADVIVAAWRAGDRELVRDATNALARRFIERRQEVQSSQARSTVRFLAVQLDTLEAQLRSAEEEIRAFREANQVVSLEAQADAQVERLAELQAQRDQLDNEREALSELMERIRSAPEDPSEPSPYRRLVAFPTLLRNQATSELLRLLGEQENERAEMLIRRTPEDRDVRVLTARIQEIESQLHSIAATYLEGLEDQVASINRTLALFEDTLARVPAREIQYARMKRQVDVLSDIYTLLQTRRKEAEIAASVEDVSVRVVDPALLPREPVRPRPLLSLLLAGIVGVAVGLGGALAREHLDASVHTRDELQRVSGVPVLGLIPVLDGDARRSRIPGRRAATRAPRLVADASSGDPGSEAYRALRTNIRFSRAEEAPRSLVVTSPMPGDGKTTTVANLAVTLAQQGQSVLLVDADLRRGAAHELFSVSREPGLSNLLLGHDDWTECVRRVETAGGTTLHVLPSGTPPPNPAELLTSEAMEAILERAEGQYDSVVIDAPPLNVVTDAAVLGARADGVILVARAGVTEVEPLDFAVGQLEQVRAPLLGTVLNGVAEAAQSYYGSGRHRAQHYFDRKG